MQTTIKQMFLQQEAHKQMILEERTENNILTSRKNCNKNNGWEGYENNAKI